MTTPIDDTNLVANLVDRDTVANVHFGIPHHHDGSKDDIQLLYVNNFIRTYYFGSPNDIGDANLAAAGGFPATERDGYQYSGSLRRRVAGQLHVDGIAVLFPEHGNESRVRCGDPTRQPRHVPERSALFKVQYQKNFSSNAYFRLYGYTGYSDWLQNGQDFAYYTYGLGQVQDGVSPDYNLFSHTRGISGTFADQINAQNLLQLQGSYTTATTVRDNGASFRSSGGARGDFRDGRQFRKSPRTASVTTYRAGRPWRRTAIRFTGAASYSRSRMPIPIRPVPRRRPRPRPRCRAGDAPVRILCDRKRSVRDVQLPSHQSSSVRLDRHVQADR